MTACVPSPADKEEGAAKPHGDYSEPAEVPEERDYSPEIAHAKDLTHRLYQLVQQTQDKEIDMQQFAVEAKPLQDSLSILFNVMPGAAKKEVEQYKKSLYNSNSEQ